MPFSNGGSPTAPSRGIGSNKKIEQKIDQYALRTGQLTPYCQVAIWLLNRKLRTDALRGRTYHTETRLEAGIETHHRPPQQATNTMFGQGDAVSMHA